jgi:hypothetical protein
VSLLFGLLCVLSGGWTLLAVPMGTAVSYCAGLTSLVGSFFVFIGLLKGELGE